MLPMIGRCRLQPVIHLCQPSLTSSFNTINKSPMPDEIPTLLDRASPSCAGGGFVAGTPVWTDKGLVPIEQVKVGDAVLSRPKGSGTPDHRTVTRTLAHDDKEIVCVRYIDPTKPNTTFILYSTGDHSFWVDNAGWTEADLLRGSERLQLQDDRVVDVLMVSPVYRTARPNVGWFNTSLSMDDVGYEADFSGAPNILQFNAYSPDELDEPDPRLKVRIYNLDVEDFHTYYVGAQGVWVHDAHCALGKTKKART